MTEIDNSENLPVVEDDNQPVEQEVKPLTQKSETLGQLTLEDKLKEAEEKYLRLYADFENHKRRTSREWIEMRMTAGREIMTAMVPVLDDFYRARKQMDTGADTGALKEGVELIFLKLKSTLENKGLKVMDCMGQDFDLEKHEAVAEIPGPDEMKGKILDEIEKGYLLNDKILRYAKVVVGK